MKKETRGKKPETDWKTYFNWKSYFKERSNLIPRESVLKALEIFESENKSKKKLFAADIGCGHGTDTIELLRRGWKVHAIDKERTGLTILKKSIDAKLKKNLITSRQEFETIKLDKYDLVNAGYSIPFCRPENFEELWNKIMKSIKKGGRFSGNLFGEKDTWTDNPFMNYHTKENAIKLFRGFELEFFAEKDEDGVTTSGDTKHWHVFSIVAKKL